jgi:PII-like signaling protein
VRIEGEGKLVRIFVGESDKLGSKPLYQAIVEMLREEGLAGATVLRGVEGFGAHSRLHTQRILRLSADLPMVIECVDTAERIDEMLPRLDEMVDEGLVTVERVEVIVYRAGEPPQEDG